MAEQQSQQPLPQTLTHVVYEGRRIDNPYAKKCQPEATDSRRQENDSVPTAANDARQTTTQPKRRGRGRPRKPKTPARRPANAFEEMMASQAKKDASNKKSSMKRSAESVDEDSRKKPAVPRESGKANNDELEAFGGPKKKSYWNQCRGFRHARHSRNVWRVA